MIDAEGMAISRKEGTVNGLNLNLDVFDGSVIFICLMYLITVAETFDYVGVYETTATRSLTKYPEENIIQ